MTEHHARTITVTNSKAKPKGMVKQWQRGDAFVLAKPAVWAGMKKGRMVTRYLFEGGNPVQVIFVKDSCPMVVACVQTGRSIV
jgi:hypothetical protein